MESLGKKLLITGKGRCNITSSLPIEEFIQNVPGNGMFLYSSFNNFTNQDIIELLKKEGLNVKEERGHRVFPTTDNAKDVLNALIKLLKKASVQIKTNAKVEKILVQDGKVTGLQANINGQKQTINADKIILATGGKSYPVTGSTGDGYELAKQLGHTITTIKPSLIPLTAKKEDLELLSYKDITNLLLEEYGAENTAELFKKIVKLLKLPSSVFDNKIGDYYTMLSTDKRFILLEDGKWDLRTRHTSDKIVNVIDEDDEFDMEEATSKNKDEVEDDDEDNYDMDNDDDYDDESDDDLKDLVILDEDELGMDE